MLAKEEKISIGIPTIWQFGDQLDTRYVHVDLVDLHVSIVIQPLFVVSRHAVDLERSTDKDK